VGHVAFIGEREMYTKCQSEILNLLRDIGIGGRIIFK
jgi:hypothetical protein